MTKEYTHSRTVEWILRIGIFGMFLGHGIFAFSVKQDWIKYLTSVGFSQSAAIAIMPVIGIMDITIAFCVLLLPIRVVLLAATIWTFSTALVRPISGEPWLDFIERWANWAAPLALLLLQGFPRKFKEWFTVRTKYNPYPELNIPEYSKGRHHSKSYKKRKAI